MLKFLKTFSKKKNSQLEKGNIYCVLKGIYSGEYFIYIHKETDNHVFLSLPDKQIRKVPQESLNCGLQDGILDFIEKLPNKVYNIVEKEFILLNNRTNGNCNSKEDNKSDQRPLDRA